MEGTFNKSSAEGMGSGRGKSLNKTMESDWKAWWNLMPGTSPTLHVVGNVDVGDESTAASIVFDSYQKSNPPNLVLRIVEKHIFVPRESGDTIITLHYSQPSMPGQIENVVIVYPNGDVTTINRISMAY